MLVKTRIDGKVINNNLQLKISSSKMLFRNIILKGSINKQPIIPTINPTLVLYKIIGAAPENNTKAPNRAATGA